MIKNNRTFGMIATLLASAAAFQNGAGWKMTDDGKIDVKDGNPIWIEADGTEKTMNGDAITRLNGDARNLRLAKEAVEAKLAEFKDIDPEKARKALETVSQLDAKTLIDAGKVDEVKQQITQQFQAQLAEKDKAANELQAKLNNMKIDSVFNSSEFVRDRIAVPQDMFQASFRQFIDVDEKGEIIVKDRSGNRMMSQKNVGEYADPYEGIELLVAQHPQKDVILKASDATGSGNNGNGGNRPGGRVIKRADFDKMPPLKQHETAAKANAGELQIID